MTLSEFKIRIAKKFDTYYHNIIVEINNVKYDNPEAEENLILTRDLCMDEYKVVKVEFRIIPRSLQ